MKVLDFYGDYCGPCKSLAPILDKVLEEKGLELKKINIEDDVDDLSAEYGVRGIPTVIVVDDNDKEIKRFSGMKQEAAVREFFNEF